MTVSAITGIICSYNLIELFVTRFQLKIYTLIWSSVNVIYILYDVIIRQKTEKRKTDERKNRQKKKHTKEKTDKRRKKTDKRKNRKTEIIQMCFYF